MRRNWNMTEDQVLDEQEALRHKRLVQGISSEPTDWHEAFHSPYKVVCNCEWPHVARSGSQALGLVIDIDLCCLAKAVEILTGQRFYRLTKTAPVFQWDADELVVDDRDPEHKQLRRRGEPPPFMVKRFA